MSRQKLVTRSYQEHVLEPRENTVMDEFHEIMENYSDEAIQLAAEEVNHQ